MAKLRPRLRSHARIYRQCYRGATWFVVQDDRTVRYHRIAPAANRMIGLTDGRRMMNEIWAAANAWESEGNDPPTQDKTIRLLAHLPSRTCCWGICCPTSKSLPTAPTVAKVRP